MNIAVNWFTMDLPSTISGVTMIDLGGDTLCVLGTNKLFTCSTFSSNYWWFPGSSRLYVDGFAINGNRFVIWNTTNQYVSTGTFLDDSLLVTRNIAGFTTKDIDIASNQMCIVRNDSSLSCGYFRSTVSDVFTAVPISRPLDFISILNGQVRGLGIHNNSVVGLSYLPLTIENTGTELYSLRAIGYFRQVSTSQSIQCLN
jgi:hypothetical protein